MRNQRQHPGWNGIVALVATLVVGVAACSLTPSSTPAVGPSAAAPVASGPTGGQGTTAAWADVVAAAKQEGKVTVMGPPGTETREGLTDGFRRKYPEIAVDYSAARGAEQSIKLITEQQAGQFLADVIVNGTTTQLDLIAANAVVPIAPQLVGPNSNDGSKWLGGRYDYADTEARYNIVFTSAARVPLAYHPRQVAPGEIRSYWDLLDPKWRGKITLLDPRTAGTGLGYATFLYTAPNLGPDYLAKLMDSGIIFSKDERQLLDWTARGQYPIALAPSEHMMVELISKGVPLEVIYADGMQEGSYLTASWGSVGVLQRAPRPNAAKVYLDWLLSQEGQTEVSRAQGYPSRRTDVPTDFLNPGVVPKPGVQYIEYYKESYVKLRDEMQSFLQTVIRN
jgi:iron(III) transport system substrate-binding protein